VQRTLSEESPKDDEQVDSDAGYRYDEEAK
jgi:hypothetical protein